MNWICASKVGKLWRWCTKYLQCTIRSQIRWCTTWREFSNAKRKDEHAHIVNASRSPIPFSPAFQPEFFVSFFFVFKFNENCHQITQRQPPHHTIGFSRQPSQLLARQFPSESQWTLIPFMVILFCEGLLRFRIMFYASIFPSRFQTNRRTFLFVGCRHLEYLNRSSATAT